MAVKAPFSPKELERAVNAGKFEPVYFFNGPEEHRISEAVGIIKSAILKNADPSTGWRVYDLAGTSFGDLLADVMTVSFFAERRGVLALNLSKEGGRGSGEPRLDEKEQEALLKYLESPSPDVVLVIACGKTDGRMKFWKDIASKTCAVHFESSEADRRRMVGEKLQSCGVKFSPDAREWMIERFAAQPALLDSELKKLGLYLGGKDSATLTDIEACLSVPPADDVFNLAESIAQKKMDASLEALNSLRKRGEVLLPVFAMVVRQFRVLLVLKSCKEQGLPEAETAKKCGVPPFFLRKYEDQERKFTTDQLKKCLCILSQADLKIKSSGLNDWQVFEQEIVRLIGTGHRAKAV
ncbi:MAG: DNA polymerase III subunit delta [Nitrospinae bacterium]|nr:DNA polymerase III subunit delta [Nitrospinota bacterium]